MKRIATVAAATLLTAALAGPEASAAPPPVALTVASYNIHAGIGTDGNFDLDRTATAIAATGADVVALQEVDRHWGDRSEYRSVVDELARKLHMHARFAPIYSFEPPDRGQPRREYGTAVLSRFPIAEFTNHDLTRLSTQDPDAGPQPMPGFAEVVVRARGSLVHVYSTHLDYRGDPSIRERQVAETLDVLAADEGAPRVLLGDFNTAPDAAELDPLWTELDDGFAEAGAGDGFTYPAESPEKRIDYAAVSGEVGVRGARVPATDLAATASDHRPVVADVVVAR
ncbi:MULTISPECIES: endonuclease/exonuclease/phosphatase family protein [Prauserella salsuginis group]|uniref:Endonuclease/exonuclease/phosphatase family protein n=1 Tax=Prauserella salsuginis TaxID=387889 RepID=A0ABW6G7F6_9PSEU|nr:MULTISPECIES: endonuclease/exonuclease/phosphatase family protein [Prauserella salsuginis group]MCR3720715.1 Metal-dependent hydrolase, endonuclease/exonuclease/phosphatase family [Prauserella flava]MCR3735204.1 Metal-dependent hydrolase, endonuclease/exonuclease/phosphatase family [Prauserella salsuginis]